MLRLLLAIKCLIESHAYPLGMLTGCLLHKGTKDAIWYISRPPANFNDCNVIKQLFEVCICLSNVMHYRSAEVQQLTNQNWY